MYQLRQVMDKAGISGELFDRAKEAMSAKHGGDHVATAEALAARLSECLDAVANE
jgi:hypothetical protein